MTTRRKFLKMLGIAPVAAAVTTAIVKDAISKQQSNVIETGVEEFNSPFKVIDGQTFIKDSFFTMDKNGIKGYRNGKLVVEIGKLK